MNDSAAPSLARRFLPAGLFVLPLAYAAYIASTVLHEVLGHGLSAIALGGEFHRFVVHADGFGYAVTDGADEHEVAVLAMGCVVPMLVGAVLLVVAHRL